MSKRLCRGLKETAVAIAIGGLAVAPSARADVALPAEWLNQAPSTIVLADFNHDGKLDLATGGPCEVRYFAGHGDGTFAPSTVIATLPGCHGGWGGLDWGDVNNDGQLDLAWAPNRSSQFFVIQGNGDGTFGTPVAYPGDDKQVAIALADLNGDDRDDVILADGGGQTGPLQVSLAQGNGTLGPATLYDDVGVIDVDGITAADFNGDGKPDVAVASLYGSTPGISTFLGNGNGTLQAAKLSSPPTDFSKMYPVDILDGDSLDDLLAARWSGVIALERSLGDGTFETVASLQTGSTILDFDLLDADHDGAFDLVVINNPGVLRTVLMQADSATAVPLPVPRASSPSIAATMPPWRVATGDLNGDGFDDYVTIASVGTAGGGTVGAILNLPALSVPPGSIGFAQSDVGASAATKSVTLSGAAERPVTPGSATVTGANPGDFAIVTDGCAGKALAFGQTCTVELRFTPTAQGNRAASLSIPSNDPAGAHTVDLTGSGTQAPPAAPSISPPRDTVAPALKLLRVTRSPLQRVLARGLRIRTTWSENAKLTLTLTIPAKLAGKLHLAARTKPVVVGTLSTGVKANVPKAITLKLTKRARRALANQKRVTLTLSLSARDAAGNKSKALVRRVVLTR